MERKANQWGEWSELSVSSKSTDRRLQEEGSGGIDEEDNGGFCGNGGEVSSR